MGVASRCGEQEAGMASGCGCKEIYRFPHYLSLLLLFLFFFAAASLIFFHFSKCFLFLIQCYLVIKCYVLNNVLHNISTHNGEYGVPRQPYEWCT